MLFILGPSVSVWKLRNGEFRNSKFQNSLFRLGNFGTVQVFSARGFKQTVQVFWLGNFEMMTFKAFKCEIRNGELRNGILWILDFDSLRLLISGWDAKRGFRYSKDPKRQNCFKRLHDFSVLDTRDDLFGPDFFFQNFFRFGSVIGLTLWHYDRFSKFYGKMFFS
ncbi:unnamed protein product [Rhizophagus irregularis]|nr:unnamed protein product [Rhizophagus irregularis]CAB4442183.1 unnamed protein product [Rhizophagus irregularis]